MGSMENSEIASVGGGARLSDPAACKVTAESVHEKCKTIQKAIFSAFCLLILCKKGKLILR